MPKSIRSSIKACENCKAVSSSLYRVVQDDATAWTLICQVCRTQVEPYPNYRYGGTWKADKRHWSWPHVETSLDVWSMGPKLLVFSSLLLWKPTAVRSPWLSGPVFESDFEDFDLLLMMDWDNRTLLEQRCLTLNLHEICGFAEFLQIT